MNVKDILTETGLSSTIHGIPSILRAKYSSLKVIWSIFFILSSTAGVYIVLKTIMSFLDREVVTTTSVRNQIPSEFPTITICNRNPFVTKNATDFLNEHISKEGISSSFYNNLEFKAFNESIMQKKSFGLELNELIYDCTFNLKKCDENDFVWFYHLNHGNCFRYNSVYNISSNFLNKKKIYRLGKDGGLQMKIYTGSNEAFNPEDSKGLKIMIHNSSINPSVDEGFYVPTGLETNIAVKRLFVNKKEKPYSDCVSDIDNLNSSLINYLRQNGYDYRQYDCINLCLQRFIIKTSDCFIPGINSLDSVNQCITALQINNMRENFYNFFTKNLGNDCYTDCPVECNSVEYNPLVSLGEFPSKFYSNALNSINSDFSMMLNKKNHLALNIFYDSYSYTTIQEVAKMDILDLISNIGGTLGLFIGMSFLSFAEVFEIFYLILISRVERFKIVNTINY